MRTWSMVAAVVLAAGVSAAVAASTDIDKFFRVDARVCTGGQPTQPQLAALKADGVRGIVNLREPDEPGTIDEPRLAKELGLRYVGIPVKPSAPTDQQVQAFLAATDDPDLFPAYIHCGSGNRVGAFWMIRRVVVDGWTPERAEDEAKQIGLKSPELLTFARDYVHRHPKRTP